MVSGSKIKSGNAAVKQSKISVGTGSTEVMQVVLNHCIGGDTSRMAVFYPTTPMRQTVYVANLLASVH